MIQGAVCSAKQLLVSVAQQDVKKSNIIALWSYKLYYMSLKWSCLNVFGRTYRTKTILEASCLVYCCPWCVQQNLRNLSPVVEAVRRDESREAVMPVYIRGRIKGWVWGRAKVLPRGFSIHWNIPHYRSSGLIVDTSDRHSISPSHTLKTRVSFFFFFNQHSRYLNK